MPKYETAATQILYRWYWILDQNLMVLLTTGENAAPNNDSTSTMVCCRLSLLDLSLDCFRYIDNNFIFGFLTPSDLEFQSSPCIIGIPHTFLPVSLPKEWLLDSYHSTESISGKASLNSRWISWRAMFLSVFAGFPPCFLKTQLSNNVHLP